jgi:hypothetical protein
MVDILDKGIASNHNSCNGSRREKDQSKSRYRNNPAVSTVCCKPGIGSPLLRPELYRLHHPTPVLYSTITIRSVGITDINHQTHEKDGYKNCAEVAKKREEVFFVFVSAEGQDHGDGAGAGGHGKGDGMFGRNNSENCVWASQGVYAHN